VAPSHNGEFVVKVGTGFGFTVTTVGVLVAEQPRVVTVTVYEPEVVTVIDWVWAPVDHDQLSPAEAVNTTEPPSQKVVGPPGVIVAAGMGFTVIVAVPDVVSVQVPFITTAL